MKKRQATTRLKNIIHPKNIIHLKNTQAQTGFVLISGLIILVIIAIAAIAGSQMSNLDYKMASNNAFKDEAFQNSETGRIAAADAVGKFLYERSWDNTLPHPQLTFDAQFNPLQDNSITENLFKSTSLTRDMTFTINGEVISDLYIMNSPAAVLQQGSGAQMLSGYRGAGKGSASGGAALFFELRSVGLGQGGARATTASEYKGRIY
jgi:hypothetical protein